MLRPPVRVCFVCSGNICRSPTAEVVLTHLAEQAGQDDLIRVESAGTGDWHVGDDMDERSRRTLVRAGYAVPPHVAKQFDAGGFDRHDVVVALDDCHRRSLERLALTTPDPDAARSKIVLLREFDPQLRPGESTDVADPYYGEADGFTTVLEQVERSCAGLLAAIQRAVEAGADVVQQTESPPR